MQQCTYWSYPSPGLCGSNFANRTYYLVKQVENSHIGLPDSHSGLKLASLAWIHKYLPLQRGVLLSAATTCMVSAGGWSEGGP